MYYVTRGEEQLGPLEEHEVRELMSTQQVGKDDLAWRDGMVDWMPVNTVFAQPPPVHRSTVQHAGGISRGTAGQLNWIPALTLNALALAMFILIQVEIFLNAFYRASRGTSDAPGDWLFYVGVLWIGVWAASITFSTTLHYRCWAFLPEQFRAVSPGKAVGFLFIPFFNFYWVFVSWPKLAEGYENWQRAAGSAEFHKVGGLAIAHAILFILTFVASGITLLATLPLAIANFIIFVLLYGRIVAIARDLG